MYPKAKWTNDLPVFRLGALCPYTVFECVQYPTFVNNVSTLLGSNTCTLGLMYIHTYIRTYMYHTSNCVKVGL